MRRSRNRKILYARFTPYLRHESDWMRRAAQGSSKAAWSRKYKDNDGPLRPCHIRIFGSGCAAIRIRQGFLADKSMRKWRKPSVPDSGSPWKSRLFKEIEKAMKLGIEGDSPDSISQYCSINADNSWLQRIFCTNIHYITSYNSILFHAKMV